MRVYNSTTRPFTFQDGSGNPITVHSVSWAEMPDGTPNTPELAQAFRSGALRRGAVVESTPSTVVAEVSGVGAPGPEVIQVLPVSGVSRPAKPSGVRRPPRPPPASSRAPSPVLQEETPEPQPSLSPDDSDRSE